MNTAATKRKLYELTEEHRARFPEWRDRWIANAFSTAAMTDEDRAACREAVLGLYAAANLPPPKHIVFVPSPFVLAFAGGFASAIWYASRKGFPTRAATGAATWAATRAATWVEVMERTDKVPEGMRVFYALLDAPASLVQDAPSPHGGFDLAPGIYQFTISREYDPFMEQARQVAD